MYKIGDFSKITNLSVKTLRYYNEIGLLIPEEVDIYSGYRFYGERNLKEINLIKELKAAGFSLDEIITNWNNFDNFNFEKKKEELYKKQSDIEEQIRKIDYLRNHILNGEIVTYQVQSNKIKSLKER